MKSKFYRHMLLLAGITSALAFPAYAADTSAEVTLDEDASVVSQPAAQRNDKKVLKINPITVTATGYEQLVKNAPASVTVVTAEDIAEKGYTDFAGILSDVEGIDVRTTMGRGGDATVRIRGLESSYTLILIDGIPQTSPSTGQLNQNGFGSQMQSFIPPVGAIERIEVVRGPMSTLYGSDALGGVINIITKKVTNSWHGNITYDHTFESDTNRAGTNRFAASLRGPLQENRVGMELRGSYIWRGYSRTEAGAFVRGSGVTPSKLRNYNIGGKLTFTPTRDQNYFIDIENSRVDQTQSAVTSTNLNSGMRYDRQRVTVGAQNDRSYGNWNTNFSYNATQLKRNANNGIDISAYSFETKLNMTKWEDHFATFGFRYVHERLIDPTIATYTGSKVLTGDTFALFAEDTWSFRPKWEFTYGLRYERPEQFDDHFTPRGYMVYKANDNWTVKGGVAAGFKVPTLAQTIDSLVGYTGQGTIEIYGNSDLTPEKSLNKEIGVYYSNPKGYRANLTYFNTDFKNKITTVNLYAAVGTTLGRSTYINTDRARLHGLEFASTLPFNDALSLKLNYTLTLSKITAGDGAGNPLSGTPRHAVNAKLDWAANDRTNLWFAMEYKYGAARYTGTTVPTAANLALTGKYYDPYAVFSLGGSYKFNDNVTLGLAVNNLFDKDFNEVIPGTTTYRYFSAGRTSSGTYLSGRNYWVSLSYNF